VVRVNCVSVWVARTVALGTAAPLESVTAPAISAVFTAWPHRVSGRRNPQDKMKFFRVRDMANLLCAGTQLCFAQ
jgi:hypothetical protein